ncbi:fibronectin-binding autotransporter adhesin [Nitrosomonas europaea]|nr:fibronectin-binding autotransporter adhesin [Nitrosomonas europaea]SET43447.1 fibronectin-binding autotransporter adhesin [Nitrosomonas europaea]SJZ98908.1 outer membrane autotransporter barrel domain-containing protein [Nitrosomonas europaea]HBF25006.1 autotransporter outer membrane beta-barrel domain-containing protein [Nitrosomonas sp.]
MQGQVNWTRTDYSTDSHGTLAKNRHGRAYSLSAEIGHRVVLNRCYALVPQAQLSWGQVQVNSFTDSLQNDVELGTNDRTIGRVGLAYEVYLSDIIADNRVNDAQKIYGIFNILRDFSFSNKVDVSGMTLRSHGERI